MPAQHYAMFARRHMIIYGTDHRDFAAVAIICRNHAALNERAQMRKPLSRARDLHCSSPEYNWETVSGRGTICSWIVVEKVHDPYWQHQVPYIGAVVELREQDALFMSGLLTAIEPSKMYAGMPVEAIFVDASATISLPRWRAEKADRPSWMPLRDAEIQRQPLVPET